MPSLRCCRQRMSRFDFAALRSQLGQPYPQGLPGFQQLASVARVRLGYAVLISAHQARLWPELTSPLRHLPVRQDHHQPGRDQTLSVLLFCETSAGRTWKSPARFVFRTNGVRATHAAGVAELVDAPDLKSVGRQRPCRFDSGRPHHLFLVLPRSARSILADAAGGRSPLRARWARVCPSSLRSLG